MTHLTMKGMAKPAEKINLQPSHINAYRFIKKYQEKNIVSPEMEEISKGIKLTLRQVYRVVDDLCTLGYLSRESYKKRSIKIVKPLQ